MKEYYFIQPKLKIIGRVYLLVFLILLVSTMSCKGGNGSPNNNPVPLSLVPSVPTGLKTSAGDQSSSTIILTWNAVSNANGYRIYRSLTQSGTYVRVGNDITSGTTLTDTGLSSNTTYWYKVSAFNNANEESNQSAAVSGTTTAEQITIYPAKSLPLKFIAATAMTSGYYTPSGQQRLDTVIDIANKSVKQGINAVNLVLDWNDLEPSEVQIDFDLLDSMIKAIKSRGLYCILRIYVNVNDWQAWPSWVSPVETYVNGSITNILPWDEVYQNAYKLFSLSLTNHFNTTQIQPDAFQITVGGSFGEQYLSGYNYESTDLDYNVYLDKLFNAETTLIDIYNDTFAFIGKDHILMVNSLWPSNVLIEDSVGNYARQNGVTWIQSNAGSCSLAKATYGDDNMKMLTRFKNGNAKIFLEDESGYWSCPSVNQDKSLKNRVDLMRSLQTTYGIEFNAVSINGVNGDLDDSSGIELLKQLLGI